MLLLVNTNTLIWGFNTAGQIFVTQNQQHIYFNIEILLLCLIFSVLTWTLQVALTGPGGTFNWNTWPTIAEESGMPVCTPPFFAEQSGIAVGGPSPTEDAAAFSSESTEDCIEASSSTDKISTSVSCCSGMVPWAMVTRSPSTRGIVLHERGLLLPTSPQFMSLRL